MKSRRRASGAALVLLALAARSNAIAAPPKLTGQGPRTQLIIEGKPFLMLGGELAACTIEATANVGGQQSLRRMT